MTPFFINTIRRFILRCKIDQRSATRIGDAVNKYYRQKFPSTHDFDEVMRTADFESVFGKSRKENPQKPTQLSSRSHPRHLVGKRTAQKTPS